MSNPARSRVFSARSGVRLAAVVTSLALTAACTSSETSDVVVESPTDTRSSAPTTADVSNDQFTVGDEGGADPLVPDPSGTEPTTTEPAPTGPVATPAPSVEFSACGAAECATVAVPIDPDDPALGSLDIAINVFRTADPSQRRGYLLVNPGGPGASGVQFANTAATLFPRELLDAFDIVGFDPRGVGASQPELGCGGRESHFAQLDLVDGEPETPAEVEAMEVAVARCVETTGPAAAYLGTEFVAHDMDVIRAALGADQISYYGASYGSDVGVWFATLYPQSVRSMVVDGADNPVDAVATADDRVAAQLDQIRAFDELLQAALASCDSAACPIYNNGDPTAYYLDAVGGLSLVDDARPDLPNAGFFGVISTLYAEATWSTLHQGLFALNENADPAILARSSDLQASDADVREPEWIGCLDNWSLFPQLDRATQLADAIAINAAFESEFPLLDAATTNDDNTGVCPFLDDYVPAPLDGPLDGSAVPILVIGNPSDPATPFTESVELVEDTLSNGFLVEADFPAHVVFTRGNTCVDDLVVAALVDNEVPDERRVVCPAI